MRHLHRPDANGRYRSCTVAGVLARHPDHQLIAVTEAARAKTEIDDVR